MNMPVATDMPKPLNEYPCGVSRRDDWGMVKLCRIVRPLYGENYGSISISGILRWTEI